MRIISLAKKNENDVAIIFDTGERLILSYELVLKKGLRRDLNIDEDLYHLLIDENRKYFVKIKAARLLSRRIHSINELKLKLRKSGYEPRHIEQVITEFSELNYLDDKKFAVQFIEEKKKLKRWGNNKIKAELSKRGVQQQIISDLLKTSDSDTDDMSNAVSLAEKKFRLIQKREIDRKKIKAKLMNYLFSKGFEYDVIRDVVNKLIDEDNSEL